MGDKLHPLNYQQLKAAIQIHFTHNFRSLFVVEVVPYAMSKHKDTPNPTEIRYVEVSRGIVCGAHWPSPPKFDKYKFG